MQLQRHVIYTRCTLPRCRAPEAGAGCLSQLPVDHASIAGYSVRPLVKSKTMLDDAPSPGEQMGQGRSTVVVTLERRASRRSPTTGAREGHKTRNKTSVQSFVSKLPSIRTSSICFGSLGIFQTNGRACALCLCQIVVTIHGSLPKGEDCSNENENSTITLIFFIWNDEIDR